MAQVSGEQGEGAHKKRARPADEPSDVDVAELLHLVGARIEAMWNVDGREVWWGCDVRERTGKMHTLVDEGEDGEGASATMQVPVLEVLYDANAGMGSPEREVARVCFVSDHLLYDLQTDALLAWRREGSGWTPPRESEAEDEAEAAAAAAAGGERAAPASPAKVGTTRDETVMITPKSAVDLVLSGVVEARMKDIQKLPHVQQCRVAEIVRLSKDKIASALEQQVADTLKRRKGNDGAPSDVVIGEREVKEALSTIDLEAIKAEASAAFPTDGCR